jgi:hypothetical protein
MVLSSRILENPAQVLEIFPFRNFPLFERGDGFEGIVREGIEAVGVDANHIEI